MKKYELDANKDNLIETLKKDCIGRNSEIANFLNILDNIEGNANISLDANWGNGKTFFVKQVELLLNYYRKIEYGNVLDDELVDIISNDRYLKNETLNNTFITVYYDAWLYDDHQDPLLSLIFSIIKNGYVNEDSVKKSNVKEKIAVIASSLLLLKGININFEKLIEKPESFLNTICNEEEIKTILKTIFDDIIIENCQKLIIIIDELDRCKPDYAVNLLEKVKHFFDDDRVIFLFSTNKEQLTHTVKNFYGYHFDASSYLNRFFDFQFSLINIDVNSYLNFLDPKRVQTQTHYSQKIAVKIGVYYNFSIREYNIYYQKMENMLKNINSNELNGLTYSLQIFCPIIWALRIKNVEKERKFLSGELVSELENALNGIDIIDTYAMQFISKNGNDTDKRNKLYKLYAYLFNSNSTEGFSTDGIEMWEFDRKRFFNIINMI